MMGLRLYFHHVLQQPPLKKPIRCMASYNPHAVVPTKAAEERQVESGRVRTVVLEHQLLSRVCSYIECPYLECVLIYLI